MSNKIEKGSGGKRGHSNKDNWVTHPEEKDMGRYLRRLEKRKIEYQEKMKVRKED